MQIIRKALLLLLFFGTIHSFSQDRCGTVPYMEKLRNEGKIKQTDEQFEKWLAERTRQQQLQQQSHRTQSSHYEIPVVVHVIHNGEPVGAGANISNAQIQSQIDVLNRDFKRLNTDAINTPAEFLGVAGTMNIEFVMARRDPQGLPTTGINRVQGTKTAWSMSDDVELKSLSYWPSEDYMNIWIVNFSSNFIGYAQFPVSNMPGLEEYQNGIATTDGIVIDYTTFGSIDDGPFALDPNYNRGRTTTHEVGHFLGLRHLWGDVSGCSGTDYVDDTPKQSSSTNGCPPHPQVSCSNNKMFQNYLDYTYDACMNLFTNGQVVRMSTILDDPSVPRRHSLLTSPGLLNPNCSNIDVAIQKIMSPGPITCDENSPFILSIKNRSCSALTSVTLQYTINTTAVQTVTINLPAPVAVNDVAAVTLPSVSFSEGINTVSVSVTQANGQPDEDSSNSTINGFIRVDKSTDLIPLRENFDALTWPVINPQGNINWSLRATNYNNSATVQAYSQGQVGSESWLATPALDFSNTDKAGVMFDFSYAYNTIDFDRMLIYASTDCGNTYTYTLFNRAGPELAVVSSLSPWVPASGTQWLNRYFIPLNMLAGETNIRLAFVFTNATGNNFYLDNVEFFVSDDPNPVDIGNDLYSVYWHNAYEASVTFNLPERLPVGIQVYDLMGRTFISTTANDILNQTFPVDLGDAAPGIYILRLQIGSRSFASKFYLAR